MPSAKNPSPPSTRRTTAGAARRRTPPAAAPARTGPAWLPAAEAVLWLAVAVLFVLRIAPQVRAAFGWTSASESAPAVGFSMLDGSIVHLDDLKGQVVLVNFWATWCPPCRAEMPGFQGLYSELHAGGFTVVGVSMDDGPRSAVVSFLEDRAITYPVAMATADVPAAFGGIDSFPTSFLIDRQGRIRYTVRGYFATVALRAAVDRLLAEHS